MFEMLIGMSTILKAENYQLTYKCTINWRDTLKFPADSHFPVEMNNI